MGPYPVQSVGAAEGVSWAIWAQSWTGRHSNAGYSNGSVIPGSWYSFCRPLKDDRLSKPYLVLIEWPSKIWTEDPRIPSPPPKIEIQYCIYCTWTLHRVSCSMNSLVKECNECVFSDDPQTAVSERLSNFLRIPHVTSKNVRVHELHLLNGYWLRQLCYVKTYN